MIRSLIDLQATDLINETEKRISGSKIKTQLDVKNNGQKIASFSKKMLDLKKPLREFLMQKLYHHYRLVRMSNKATRFIQELFKFYLKNPQALPTQIQAKTKTEGLRRVVCDYIAGMTDRYALDEYKKLFDPYEKV